MSTFEKLVSLMFLGLPGLFLWTGGLVSLCARWVSRVTQEPTHPYSSFGEDTLSFLAAIVGLFMVSDCEIKLKDGRPGIALKHVVAMITIAFTGQLSGILACGLIFSGLQEREPMQQRIEVGLGSVLAAISLGLHLLAFVRRAAWRREHRQSLPSEEEEDEDSETVIDESI